MENITTDFALQANNLVQAGDFEDAIALCNKGLSTYPHYPAAYCVLAKAYYFSDNHAQATNIIKQAGKHFPYNAAIKRIANDIKNETLILENVPVKDTQMEKTMQNPDVNIKEDINEIEPPPAGSNLELIQVIPEDIPDNFSQEIELIDDTPAIDSNNNSAEVEFETALEESTLPENKIDTTPLAETEAEDIWNVEDEPLDGESESDEEFHLLDDEAYFPKHVHQESIADLLDSEEDANVELADDTIMPAIATAPAEDAPLPEDTFAEEASDVLEEDNACSDATTTFMPDIPQRESSLIFDTNYEKSSVELLYEADLDLPKTALHFDYSNYSLQHIATDFPAEALQNISISRLNYNIGEYFHEAMPNDLLETEVRTTDSILDLAESLKNAKISTTAEPDEEAPEIEMPLIASETMAKILTKQKKFDKAQQIYELLIKEKPEKADYFNEQIDLLQSMLLAEEQ